MNCPKCADHPALASLVVDDVEVDRCPTCEGIWFDRAELGGLLDSQEGHVKPLLAGDDAQGANYARGACPRDQQALLRVNSLRNRAVTLDTCPLCQGIWLDGGEFARIRAAQPGVRLGEIV